MYYSLDDIKFKALEWKFKELMNLDFEDSFEKFKGKVDSIIYLTEALYAQIDLEREAFGQENLERILNNIMNENS